MNSPTQQQLCLCHGFGRQKTVLRSAARPVPLKCCRNSAEKEQRRAEKRKKESSTRRRGDAGEWRPEAELPTRPGVLRVFGGLTRDTGHPAIGSQLSSPRIQSPSTPPAALEALGTFEIQTAIAATIETF
ncbi:hypothetical protein GW7_06806 [Heterocephalus glaber]|uniref:Uncharacterized protein n=1 Tax=Heterocephalus glaber TaxID=10181 RepID=G5B8Z1_HETGA|nr:hypothetical protein GW7_06806 [Heterocephalus glaber]